MTNAKLEEMQKDLENIKLLLHGDPTKTTGGVAQFVEKLGTTVFGDPILKGGLVSDVMQIKRIMWIGIGVLSTLQIGIQILFHFWKP